MKISDINIEFAHVEFDGSRFDERIVAESARIATQLVTRYEKKGLTCCTCILIDDKNVGRIATRSLQKFLDFVGRHITRVDYICYEGQLPRYLDCIFENIKEQKRDFVAGKVYSYSHRHDKIACSHDIAIWHLMRLGFINNIDASTLFPVSALQGFGRPQAPFIAKRVISILSNIHRQHEEKAVHDILRFSKEPGITNKIERIYF
jgi:hypothetical protein